MQSKLKMLRLKIDFCSNTDWLLKWKLKYWAPWNHCESKSLSIFHSGWRRQHAAPFSSAIFSIVMSFVHKCQQNKLQICWCGTFSITLHSHGRSLHFIYSKHIFQSNFQVSPQQKRWNKHSISSKSRYERPSWSQRRMWADKHDAPMMEERTA